MKKILITGMLLFALCIGHPVIATGSTNDEEVNFQDIQGHWAQSDIELIVQTGALAGYPDGTFKPNESISRAQFSKILGSLMDVSSENPAFTDIAGHWAQSYISGLVDKGVILPSEYPHGYAPNAAITRLEMSQMISRALATEHSVWQEALHELQQMKYIKLPFTDGIQLASADKPYVALASGSGIVNGLTDGSFRADGLATRAEAAVMLARYLQARETAPNISTLVAKFEGKPTIYEMLQKPNIQLEQVRYQIVYHASSETQTYTQPFHDLIWDGEKYIALGDVGRYHVPHVFISTDGVNWEDQGPIPVFGLSKLIYDGSKYMAVGDFTPVGNSATMYYVDENGERKLYEGNGRNEFDLLGTDQINVAASKDGSNWEVISGYHEPGTGGSSRSPDIFLFEKDGLIVLLHSMRAFFSSNGEDFTSETKYTITDPRNVTPPGYNYLGKGTSLTTGDQKLAFDGKAYYNTISDYFGFGIIRSTDVINWEFVYFDPRTDFENFHFHAHRIFINDGKYYVINGDKIVVSDDGINWRSETFEASDMFTNGQSYSSRAIYYKGYYFMKKVMSHEPTLYVTKDFKEFSEIKAADYDQSFSLYEREQILYVDDNYIFTTFNVYTLVESEDHS